MLLNRIDNRSCLQTMKEMPNNFVKLTVTSPPYDNLRTYSETCNDNSWNPSVFKNIANLLYLVTQPGGMVVWVVGDAVIKGGESGNSFRQALYFQEIGFLIHDTMIFEKSPSFPSSKKRSTRYSQAFEYMFCFSKGKPATVNLIDDRKNRWAGCASFGTQSERLKNGEKKTRGVTVVKDFGVRFNIWKYASGHGNATKDKIASKHPAIFPEALAADHIKSWSNPGDLVYDPFAGSGTTLKMAKLLGRNYLGSEIVPEYCKIAEERLALCTS